jgi:hypothetical protein
MGASPDRGLTKRTLSTTSDDEQPFAIHFRANYSRVHEEATLAFSHHGISTIRFSAAQSMFWRSFQSAL